MTLLDSLKKYTTVVADTGDINAIAFHCLEAGLAGLLLVLVDEAVATFIGMRIMFGEFRLDRRDKLATFRKVLECMRSAPLSIRSPPRANCTRPPLPQSLLLHR